MGKRNFSSRRYKLYIYQSTGEKCFRLISPLVIYLPLAGSVHLGRGQGLSSQLLPFQVHLRSEHGEIFLSVESSDVRFCLLCSQFPLPHLSGNSHYLISQVIPPGISARHCSVPKAASLDCQFLAPRGRLCRAEGQGSEGSWSSPWPFGAQFVVE